MAETRSTRLKYVKRKRICFHLKKVIANTELFVVKTEISSNKKQYVYIHEPNPNLLTSGAKRVQKPIILLWKNLTFAKLFAI